MSDQDPAGPGAPADPARPPGGGLRDRPALSRWLKLAFLAGAAVLVAELVVRDREGPPARGAIDVDAATAPEAPPLALPTLEGKTVDLASLRGKVVAVNFWATWCGPCQREMPGLAALWRSRHERCLEILGVAAQSPRKDTEETARTIPYPILVDEHDDAVDDWDVRTFPRTYLVDASGRVRKMFRGAVDEETLAQAIDPLLPASCAKP